MGATDSLSSLTVSGTSAIDGGSVTTTGIQTYTGAATLGQNTTLIGTVVVRAISGASVGAVTAVTCNCVKSVEHLIQLLF